MEEKLDGKNRRIYILVLALLFVSVAVFLVSFYIDSRKVLDVKELNMSLTVGNIPGFDVSKDRLGFGELAIGNSASRNDVYITNPYDFPIEVDFLAEGNITNLIIYTKKLELSPGDKRSFSASTVVISNETPGYYGGKLIITFKRA
ncbi:MAG: hypothetical protein AABW50_01430 [Nanoarchaeota archaeon]